MESEKKTTENQDQDRVEDRLEQQAGNEKEGVRSITPLISEIEIKVAGSSSLGKDARKGIQTTTHREAEEIPQDGDHEDINHLSFRPVEPVNVQVRNLSITVDIRPSCASLQGFVSFWKGEKDTKMILDDISADMPAGQMMAIIGGSGSGKVSQRLIVIKSKLIYIYNPTCVLRPRCST